MADNNGDNPHFDAAGDPNAAPVCLAHHDQAKVAQAAHTVSPIHPPISRGDDDAAHHGAHFSPEPFLDANPIGLRMPDPRIPGAFSVQRALSRIPMRVGDDLLEYLREPDNREHLLNVRERGHDATSVVVVLGSLKLAKLVEHCRSHDIRTDAFTLDRVRKIAYHRTKARLKNKCPSIALAIGGLPPWFARRFGLHPIL
jgi:hypothetical protein